MKLDIKEIVDGLKDINKRLGFEYKAISSAIKVCEMWQEFKDDSCEFNLINIVEERFFPSIIKQTVTVEIQGKDEESLRDTIQQVRLLYGVKDVRPHDSRY